jgi:hypothetical protein
VARTRDRMFPLGAKLVQRAKDAGALRADFQAEDLPMLVLMLTTILDSARDVEPDLWRRYLEIVIQGLRAEPDPPDPLTTPALQSGQVPCVMAACKLSPR